ncbi:MAG TPA: DUF6364 family protein [Prolixibacteraceae bacterium]|nr:DUF6364 family protein [Prolixibacteraceae bacterium]HPT31781.1 DUF6364 family protein [Prolixibacteraceae bacterium]
MDAKLTLHFDREVIEKAKIFAEDNHISLSRLTEFLYRQITLGDYKTLGEFPIADWVNQVAEGEAVYIRRTRQSLKDDFMKSRK